MSGLLKKKIEMYLAAREVLQTRYQSLIDLADPSLKASIGSVYEFDLLNYSYIALKTYYETSKSKWDSDYRNLLDELASVNARIELKLPIYDLYEKVYDLFALRREFKQNAQEAGKVSHLLISSLATPNELMSIMAEISKQRGVPRAATYSANPAGNVLTPKTNSPVARSETARNVRENVSESAEPQSLTDKHPNAKLIEQEKKERSTVQNSDLNATQNDAASGKSAPPPSTSQHSVARSPIPKPSAPALQAKAPQTTRAHSAHSPVNIFQDASTVNQPQHAQSSIHEPHSVPLPVNSKEPHHSNPAGPSILSNSPNTSKKRQLSPSGEDVHNNNKRFYLESGILKLKTWSRSHIKTLIFASMNDLKNPVPATQEAFRRNFNVDLSIEEAESLRLHYGLRSSQMEKYRYNIQVFHLVASSIYSNMTKYVVIPWEEIRLQFSRKTGMNIPDWEVRGRYYLFLLHRNTYGRLGEPSSNYCDLVASFHKIKNPNMKTMLPAPLDIDATTMSPPSKAPNSTSTPPSARAGLSYPPPEIKTWTAKDLDALVEAELSVPSTISNRSSVMVQYLRLKTGKLFDVADVEKRRKLAEFQDMMKDRKKMMSVKKSLHKRPAPDSQKPLVNSQKPVPTLPTPKTLTLPDRNQFDILLEAIAKSTKDNLYYSQKLSKGIITDFWDIEKSKSLITTVEYMSKIDPDTKDVTQRVARMNMIKILMLRLLREHQVKIHANVIETRLKRMMETDVFDEALCRLINERLNQ